MIPVVVHGALGRMGRLVTVLCEAAPDVELVGLVAEPGCNRPAGTDHARLPVVGQERLAEVLPPGGVVIDFSLAGALAGLLAGGRSRQAALVVGTTGFSPDQEAALQGYAAALPVVRAANFSLGIPALQMLLQLLARTLPGEFDAEEVETHHITKLDRPSGTARHLAEIWQQARGRGPVPVHSQRLGGVIGEHTWTFSDQEETLVLTHRAHSRQAFLRGILPAVRFVHGRAPGLYGLTDVLQELGRT